MNHSCIAAIQMTSGMSVEKNLKRAEIFIAQAVSANAKLIVLPENFALMANAETDKLMIKEIEGQGPIQDFLANQAIKHHVWIIGGTIPLVSPDPHKVYNACTVYNDQGQQIACYKKIHLFDVEVQPGVEVYEESKFTHAGEKVAVFDTPAGRVGLAICYDLRFPELFRELSAQRAEIIAVPTAFTVKTGQAHWDVLMRARAIENICYVIGACQTGTHENGRKTFGHSLIIDPWGTVLCCLSQGPGIIQADISLEHLQALRGSMPVHRHRRMSAMK
jgi:nitrilase